MVFFSNCWITSLLLIKLLIFQFVVFSFSLLLLPFLLFLKIDWSSIVWARQGSGLIFFNWLSRHPINRTALDASDKLTGAKSKAYLGLATTANAYTIERFAFIHILAWPTDVYLSIAWNTLSDSAKFAGDLPL